MDEERTVEKILEDYHRQEENRKAGEVWNTLFSCPYAKTCTKACRTTLWSDGMVIENCFMWTGEWGHSRKECPSESERLGNR